MQVATVMTETDSLRSTIDGVSCEDSALFVRRAHPMNPHSIFVGYTPSPKTPLYGTVLEMLADGWSLLSAPTRTAYECTDGTTNSVWVWWLTREGAK